MFRISTGMDWPILDVTTVGETCAAIRARKPGRFHIDEIIADPLPSGRTSRRWGVGVKQSDGTVTLVPDRRTREPLRIA